VPDSTEVDNGIAVAGVPDSGVTLCPLDEGGVNLGVLPAGGQFIVTFRVMIDNPLPAGVDHVVNQATASALGREVDTAVDTPVAAAPLIEAEKADVLAVDADGNGVPSPGDTLRYDITITNNGNAAATGVTFTDIPDPNTTLVVGSVQTTQGTVTRGNTSGDTDVAVDIGTLPAVTSVTITFEVTIDNPLPVGVTQIANNGLVSSNELPTEPTDDPDTLPDDDRTITPVTAAPELEAQKRDELFTDADGNGVASPGDTLLYRITIVNSGNTGATGVTFTDIPDPNTTLVVGSVQTSQGTVTRGNASGDTDVAVDIGTIPAGGSVTVIFRVTIDDPLPAGVTQVANNGLVSSNELPTEPTDDPDTPADGDRTVTPVAADPELEAQKRDELIIDADGNGVPSPGDTLLYVISIINSGNGAATGVTFNDTPDLNTTLVVGSVRTSYGTITRGNNPGDVDVAVNISTIAGGGRVDITFQVIINNPLPAGVTQVANHGLVSSNELPTEPTDDPDTLPDDDETVTPVAPGPRLEADKRDELLIDVNGDGIPSPGDTLLYHITIANYGCATTAATGVTFADTPDPNTALVVGSVQTSQGTVTRGNSPGDTDVAVDVGTIPGGATVRISFQVIIDDPLPPGVTQVANQGLVSSNELPDEPTNDPDSLPDDDETVTPVTAAPHIEAYKSDELLIDADRTGGASPGDTLLYNVTIVSNGNAPATGVTFTDTPDPNTTLVVGSVRTSQGTVLQGNNPGDRAVTVDIGAIPAGGVVEISLEVTINDPLPGGVTQVSNQGLVSLDMLPNVPTDDPGTPVEDDSTPTAVELIYFRAAWISGRDVRLEWATAVEIDNFGFNVYRASVDDRSRASLLGFVPSQARGAGATYGYEDTVPVDGFWWYWLADVDTAGLETFHGPVIAGVGANTWSHRIYLPLVVR